MLLLYSVRNNEGAFLAQSVEHAAVNRGVVGSSPSKGATYEYGQLEKRLNSHAFHACTSRVRIPYWSPFIVPT